MRPVVSKAVAHRVVGPLAAHAQGALGAYAVRAARAAKCPMFVVTMSRSDCHPTKGWRKGSARVIVAMTAKQIRAAFPNVGFNG
jgi:hypothetical protein